MSILSRIFRSTPDPREELRPLWHSTVGEARTPIYYTDGGVADTVEGRFDLITIALAVVLVRMEDTATLTPKTALLTEFFVEDMDGQLREQGVGDPVMGKHIGKLMSTLGGRIGAIRTGLREDRGTLAAALRRNVRFVDESKADALAALVVTLFERLERTDADALLRGEIAA